MTSEQKRAFRAAVSKFVDDLRSNRFRGGLRVKGVRGRDGVFEMTWAPDGRALFRYGEPVRPGNVHIVWLSIGTHEVFRP